MEELKEKIVEIIKRQLNLPHYKVFLFGSQANKKADERSDLDIGIEASSPLPPHVLAKIREELDQLPVIQKIDLVDFNLVSSDFKEVALQSIEVLYEK